MHMSARHIACAVIASAISFSSPVLAAIQVTEVVSGLSSPLFVGHAGDGSQRLFIEERAGIIKVLQPGSTVPTVFLDIRTKILSGGERGLLGLAFHPSYGLNRRFFVFYTRAGDGAIVIAEYKASTANPNVADTAEIVLLTIPHPTNANHNGGMLAFGPDKYLYIGVGDGGSANDPPNNAQNIEVLLGKILRINVDQADPVAGTPYSAPAGNPFLNAAGRDEIYSIGWRNPWRFSFDRQTGQQWVADVGQGLREEVDTPVLAGGNYGWRVYEGFACTNNDPALCNPANYVPPVFDYLHSGGRCSITGGYPYRGSLGSLPAGTYIYGDYCTGEILTWNGTTQTLEIDTPLNISSFGEDEFGELYVVGLGGTISRIDAVAPTCTNVIAPTSRSLTATGGSGSVTVTAAAGCSWTAVANDAWIHVTAGANGSGNGTVAYSVDANAAGAPRTGTVTIAGRTFTVSQTGVACTFEISPSKADFGINGGTAMVAVTAPVGCSWTAVSSVDWITITGVSNTSGNGTVSYSVAVYTGRPRNRNATMAIAGKTFAVKQSR